MAFLRLICNQGVGSSILPRSASLFKHLNEIFGFRHSSYVLVGGHSPRSMPSVSYQHSPSENFRVKGSLPGTNIQPLFPIGKERLVGIVKQAVDFKSNRLVEELLSRLLAAIPILSLVRCVRRKIFSILCQCFVK
jgi:hypothetical protein